MKSDFKVLQFHNLGNHTKISHCITTRNCGISNGKYKSLNLSLSVGDNLENVIENRNRLASFFKIDSERLFFPQQCHTNHIKVISGNDIAEDLSETDSLITNIEGIALAVLAADCTPILLYDPIQRVIAAVHAGWRGTIQNIALSTIEEMRNRFKCKPQNIQAGIGPCISYQSYEVGEEVAVEFRKLFGNNSEIIIYHKSAGKSLINLQEANRLLLLQCGILSENIEVADICTYNNPDKFFSARRDGRKCGRFATAIMLNK